MSKIKLFTIGFTKTNAETFFAKLDKAGVKTVIDIRLNNISQLSGFAKKNDLIYFLKQLCSCEYEHMPFLAPTKDILDDYKKKKITWSEYETQFLKLISDRQIEHLAASEKLNKGCLLCSEPTPEKCHRRLVAEYFKEKFENIEIIHL